MNSLRSIACALLTLASAYVFGGDQRVRLTLVATAERPVAEAGDLKDDPGYAMYKEGYGLILEERWDEARKKFAEMKKQFPKSDYVVDAQYWSAYALKHLDAKKAGEEYQEFIKQYPTSRYLDDAVADLDQLNANGAVVYSTGAPAAVSMGRRGSSYGYGIGANSEQAVRALERSLRKLNRLNVTVARPTLGIPVPVPDVMDDEKLDPETQLKIEALYALGNAKEDEKSFTTLKGVALDTKAALPLRRSALDALSDFKKFDVLPVYLEIARRDTAAEMQDLAIDFISNHGKDKNKSVATLIDLFNTLPKTRVEQRRTVFYFIAEVGNDRAVDFLGMVATTSDDYDLRREAISYLGSIGSDKARTVLYGILGAGH